MEVPVELVAVGVGVLGSWLSLWRRLGGMQTRLEAVHACLDDAQGKIADQNQRLSRIEGRLEEREMRWDRRFPEERNGEA